MRFIAGFAIGILCYAILQGYLVAEGAMYIYAPGVGSMGEPPVMNN